MSNPKEIILERLRNEDGFVSGQDLSDLLGISRAAVSKHVKGLRETGYQIESVPRHGHRLVASVDTPLEVEVRPYLDTRTIGSQYIFNDSMSSTNNYLDELPLTECSDGMVVVADTQSAGRGRMKRTWFSPPAANLYFSVLLQPARPPHEVPQLALVAAASIIDTLKTITPSVDAGIKWPNDILVSKKKLAGVLCEMQAETDVVHKAILGIGININIPVKSFPKELRDQSTSLLAETGKPLHRPVVLAALLNSIDRHYNAWLEHGLDSSLPLIKKHLLMVDTDVAINSFGKKVKGTVQGISPDGGLIIKSGNKKQTVYSGEMNT
ncbi:biotin--[acetyl-CoA-carboxylase] ligase [bacterium E08(2017)]|nr:biotin--[acetyl-CoA-carboxylase] ligase [bacterium E08(2017)]